jgi:APA family basic amino acid/polyamine antiporter
MTQSTSYSQATPKNQIGLAGAIAIGLASMLGAGLFVVFRDVAIAAGSLQFWSLVIAGAVAILNSASIYQLAKSQSRAGGVYAYSRVYVSKSVSFIAGFSFVFGKIGSIAAIALVFEEYVAPDSGLIAPVLAILLLTLVNIFGINRTASVAAILAIVTTLFLLVSIFVSASFSAPVATEIPQLPAGNLLQGASLMFFAFAGYARVATLGDEVRNPKKNIPKAMAISLGIVLGLYIALSVVINQTLGPDLIESKAPFVTLLSITAPWFPTWLIVAVAALAALGSMLALLAGVSRTISVMAEDAELPKIFATRNRWGTPWLAEVVIALGAMLLLSVGSVPWVIGFSSFSVLLYYAIGHLSSVRQPAGERIMPKWLNYLGGAACLVLVFSVPGPAIPVSLGFLAFAVAARKLTR